MGRYQCREKRIEKIKKDMGKLQAIGLVGKTVNMPDGDIAWEIGPEHTKKMEFLRELLGHPEQWDELPPALRDKKDQLLALRQGAIKKGLIA